MATTPNGSVVEEVNSGEDDPVPPRGMQEEMIEENGEPPQPIMDSAVMETQAVVQVHTRMGDTFQALQNPLAQ